MEDATSEKQTTKHLKSVETFSLRIVLLDKVWDEILYKGKASAQRAIMVSARNESTIFTMIGVLE